MTTNPYLGPTVTVESADRDEVERQVTRLLAERPEARAAIRRAQDAIKAGAVTAGAVALAICGVGDGAGPSLLDELDAARKELAALRDQLAGDCGACGRGGAA